MGYVFLAARDGQDQRVDEQLLHRHTDLLSARDEFLHGNADAGIGADRDPALLQAQCDEPGAILGGQGRDIRQSLFLG